jgi:UDP-GlcNAc:undecaprenyl-phosphate GlcNAc-1-phosphate transferase
MSFSSYSYAFLCALFSSLILVPFLRSWALDRGQVDIPDERKVHVTPTPRIGGIAIFLSLALSCWIYMPLTTAGRGFMAGGLIIFVTGLIDDFIGLTAKQKFVGEIIACLATIGIGDIYLNNLGNLFGFGEILLPYWIGVLFTIFAVVGVINAINLIDGLDGLAGGVSMIAIFSFLFLGWQEQNLTVVYICIALAGAILGFLKYNFYPARIFMGDVGSLTVGFILGFLAVHLTQAENSTVGPMVPVLILGVPLLDTLKVMIRRVRKKLSPFAPDNKHVHHKFLHLGFGHRFTVIVIYGLVLFWSWFAIQFRHWPEYGFLLAFLVVMLSFYEGLRYIKKHQDRYEIFRLNSSEGVRKSELYQSIANAVDRIVLLIICLLAVFMLLAILSVTNSSNIPWPVLFALLVVVFFSLLLPAAERQQNIIILLLYVVGFLAVYEVAVGAKGLNVFGLNINQSGDLVLFLIACLVPLKLIFYRTESLKLTPFDYLTLGACLLLTIAAEKSVFGGHLDDPLLRALVVIIALRTVLSRSPSIRRYAVWGSISFLSVALFSGLLSG